MVLEIYIVCTHNKSCYSFISFALMFEQKTFMYIYFIILGKILLIVRKRTSKVNKYLYIL